MAGLPALPAPCRAAHHLPQTARPCASLRTSTPLGCWRRWGKYRWTHRRLTARPNPPRPIRPRCWPGWMRIRLWQNPDSAGRPQFLAPPARSGSRSSCATDPDASGASRHWGRAGPRRSKKGPEWFHPTARLHAGVGCGSSPKVASYKCGAAGGGAGGQWIAGVRRHRFQRHVFFFFQRRSERTPASLSPR